MAEEAKRGEDVKSVDVFTAKGLLSTGHLYLDVSLISAVISELTRPISSIKFYLRIYRTSEEFKTSHIENAINVPYMFKTQEGKVKNPQFLTRISSILKKQDHLVVGCNSGGRSLKACVDLLNEGFEHVTNMEGGYSSWVDNGLAGDKDKLSDELKVACKFRPRKLFTLRD
ncbi:hypothetical protein ACLB2K_067289 [Fragaria x ananassa]